MRVSFSSLLIVCLPAAVLVGATAEAQPYRPPPPRLPFRGEAPPAGPGRLRNRAQNMCLDVRGWSAQGDGNVLLWDCNGDPDQVWSFTPGRRAHRRRR